MRQSYGIKVRSGRSTPGSPPLLAVSTVTIDAGLGPVNLTTPNTYQLSATVGLSDNTVSISRPVVWSSNQTGFATVNASTGLVTAVGVGTATITATCETMTDTINVVVTNPLNAVASVTLSPSSLSLIVGGSTQVVTATAWDGPSGTGNILTGRTVTWNSSATSKATIGADSGTDPHQASVTAVAAGTSNITATCETIVSSAIVATASLSTGFFPNEPATATILTSQPYDIRLPSGIGGSVWTNVTSSAFSIVSDATAPYSPSNIGRATFSTTNPAAGSAPINEAFNSTAFNKAAIALGGTQGVKTLYVAWFMRISANWDQNNANHFTKLFFSDCLSGASGTQPQVVPVLSSSGSGNTSPLRITFRNQAFQVGTQAINWEANMNQSSNVVTRGTWAAFEMKLVRNTPGLADGEFHLWIAPDIANNQSMIKIFQQTTQSMTLTGPSVWNSFRWNPTWGGGGPAPIVDNMFMDIDHFRLSGIL